VPNLPITFFPSPYILLYTKPLQNFEDRNKKLKRQKKILLLGCKKCLHIKHARNKKKKIKTSQAKCGGGGKYCTFQLFFPLLLYPTHTQKTSCFEASLPRKFLQSKN